MDVEELNANELHGFSSNSEIDDEICEIHSREESTDDSVSHSPSSLHVDIEFSDVSSTSNTEHDTLCGNDIEILEENNNDPNNNLNSIQSLQELANSYSQSGRGQVADFTESLNDAMPGCSRDFDDPKSRVANDEIHKETLEICKLLPKLKYELVHAVLCKNRTTENRTELSLWDLLPKTRPKVELSSKRKHTDGNCLIAKQSRRCVSMTKNNAYDKDIILIDDNSSRDSLNTKNTVNNGNSNNIKDFVKGNGAYKSTRNKILCPAKLILNREPSHTKDVTSSNPIVSESKLSGVNAQQCTDSAAIKTLLHSRHHKIWGSISDKRIPLKKSLFMSKSAIRNNNTLGSYMHYLDFVKSTKESIISDKYPEYFNPNIRANIRKCFLQPATPGLDINISQSGKTKMLEISNGTANKNSDDKEIEYLDQQESTSSGALSLQDASSDGTPTAVSSGITIDLTTSGAQSIVAQIDAFRGAPSNEPSTSKAVPSVSGEMEILGGTKKKEQRRNRDSNTKTEAEKEEIALLSQFQLAYDEIIRIYPELDEDSIRQMYKTYCDKARHVHPNILLQKLIAYRQKNENTTKISFDETLKEEQYAHLSNMFPNADPVYLRKTVQRIYNKPDVIAGFIESQCKHPTYPTKEEKLRRQRITEQQQQYTDKFNVEGFLKTFPDPFAHFEDRRRVYKFSKEALQLLTYHFRRFKESTLEKVYIQNKYHLTLTAQTLQAMEPDGDDGQVIRGNCRAEDISVMQEFAFITHKVEIREYMDRLKEEEAREFDELKRKKELLTCECCYNDECIPSKCSTCNNGHIFCNPCILKGAEVKLAEGETHIPCFENCSEEFSLCTLEKILSPTQFNVLNNKRQETEVMTAKVRDLESCPFCHFACVPVPEDKIFKCLNPECMKESCRSCKELNHVPLKCYEGKSEKARLLLEEKMTEALLRKCNNCARPYVKVDGCNKITCPCGATMCYICEKPVDAYSHFDDRYQSSTLCPLWSNTIHENNEAVQAVGQHVVKRIKQIDPRIEINTNGLLEDRSAKPSTSNGLPSRVQRVMRMDDTDIV